MAANQSIQAGKKLSINFMTNMQKLHKGIWPWTVGLKSRLPMHYKIRYCERWMREPAPVHYVPDTRKYIADLHGVPKPVQNTPIPITFPREADMGLWGGEGIIAGFKKKGDEEMKPRGAKIWKPKLLSRVLYSEILDRWMEITVTVRTLDLIDEAFGFDNYILRTHEVDMCSKLGMKLKREMLLVLARKSMYPNDPAKRDAVYEKYKQFEILEEEAEWVGLSLYEAERKQHEVEESERMASTKPLKHVYFDQLAKRLKDVNYEPKEESKSSSGTSFLQKLSPFQKKD